MARPHSDTKRYSGVFITLEGGEGSGKTTQRSRLARRLRREGYDVVVTREPGGTPLAEQLRRIILDPESPRTHREQMHARCEALLILASRSQHVAALIRPALEAGNIVLCDRFSDSTLAYQGFARGLDPHALRSIDRFATRSLSPDLTLLLDVPVAKGLARRRRPGKAQDRLDRETRRFHEKVRRGFLRLAVREPGRITTVDAGDDPAPVAARVASIVLAFLRRRRVRAKVSTVRR